MPLEGPLLDIGCGNGVIGKMLFKNIDLGLDISMPVLQKAEGKKVYSHFVLADARRLPFKSGIFRSVISNCVLEHVKQVEDVIVESSVILQKGGKLVFTVPSEYFSRFLFLSNSNYVKLRNRQLLHVSMFDSLSWESLCKRHNFTVLKRCYYINFFQLKVWDFLDFFYHVPILRIFWHGLWDRLLKPVASPLLISFSKTDVLNKGAGLLIVAERN
jgi:SAM-dependent methyltransferase